MYDKGDQKANMVPIYNDKGKVTGFQKIDAATEEDDDNGLTPIPSTANTPIAPQKKYGGSIKAKNGSIVSLYKKL
jgi:hypothetical protein